ncbi:MAG: hypothetical protein AAFU64_04815, partial [Bacteroidota bacterium]
MKTKQLILFNVFLTLPFLVHSQDVMTDANYLKTAWISMVPIDDQVAQEHHYLEDDWQTGDVYLKEGRVIQN